MRHGKAEDPDFTKRDFDRNLVNRGQEDANQIGKALWSSFDDRQKATIREANSRVKLISSTANRAIQTAELVANVFEFPSDRIQREIEIYEAYHLDILKVINRVPDEVETVFIFGHNPGLSMLVNYLTDQHVDLKTANAAHLILNEEFTFAELSEQTATLQHVFE